jgi:3-oxoacyl-[acyl-carrier protein] reductase
VALAESGWDVATTNWRPYDAAMPWEGTAGEADAIIEQVRSLSDRAVSIEADLADAASPGRIFDFVEESMGPVTALVMSHCHSVDSDTYTATIESFNSHFAVNARATWLLIREFGIHYRGGRGSGRIISITSDHAVGNLPCGASKRAMDRIVLAAARDLQDLGITANVINPGAVDTGWMDADLMELVRGRTPLGRVAVPADTANLARFLCSDQGGWINGQLLYTNGGFT